jgi:hypothetical protein
VLIVFIFSEDQVLFALREHPDEGRTAISLTADCADKAQENVDERTKDSNFGTTVLFVAAVDGGQQVEWGLCRVFLHDFSFQARSIVRMSARRLFSATARKSAISCSFVRPRALTANASFSVIGYDS